MECGGSGEAGRLVLDGFSRSLARDAFYHQEKQKT
jgi:hypothetical protein